MDEPLRVHSPREFEFFLEVTPCAKCGHGPLVPISSKARGEVRPGELPTSVRTRCHGCRAQRTFHVEWTPQFDEQPSEIVDLAQWVGLYFQYADRMDKAPSPAASRTAAGNASECLAEALRFYGTDEMPPESAFRVDASVAAFENNPATFARTHLRELQAVLPQAGWATASRSRPAGAARSPGGCSGSQAGRSRPPGHALIQRFVV